MGRLMRRLACACGATILFFALVHCGSGGSSPPPLPRQLQILTTTLPDGIAGSAYDATLQATGGTGGYTRSATNLPSALTLNASTGRITGTLDTQATGYFYPTLSVRDSAASPQSASNQFVLIIRPILTINGDLGVGHLSFPYTASLSSSTGAVGTWTVRSGALPPGLALVNPSPY